MPEGFAGKTVLVTGSGIGAATCRHFAAVCVGSRPDGTAHAGKLFSGSCYYEYGGHEESTRTFEWLAAHTYP
jgi:NAD(P)-dependent dehydrogenase (short-subunit alcohol dehydrogenase family)